MEPAKKKAFKKNYCHDDMTLFTENKKSRISESTSGSL